MKKPRQPSQDRAREIGAPNLPPKEILDKLPENVRISIIEAASFSGPLPPPTMFQGYETVLPGSAERILTMVEKEQEHRMHWEGAALTVATRETLLGQWFGLLIAAICIGSAVFLAMNEHQWVAGVLAGASAIGLVGRFIRRN